MDNLDNIFSLVKERGYWIKSKNQGKGLDYLEPFFKREQNGHAMEY